MVLCGMFLLIFTASTLSSFPFFASLSCQPLTNQRIHEATTEYVFLYCIPFTRRYTSAIDNIYPVFDAGRRKESKSNYLIVL